MTSTFDVRTQDFLEAQAERTLARRHELWRWVLTQKMGREFLHTAVLGELGFLQHIHTDPLDRLHGDVALHNLCCAWMATYVLRHRDLYLQMVSEATKRDEEERQALEALRAEWESHEDSEDV